VVNIRHLLPLVAFVLIVVGCVSNLGLVIVTTVDGNHIRGMVTNNGDQSNCMVITGDDGSEYHIKYRSIRVIERLGDAPPPRLPLPSSAVPSIPANAPAEAPPPKP
jgi:hypothetical protein